VKPVSPDIDQLPWRNHVAPVDRFPNRLIAATNGAKSVEPEERVDHPDSGAAAQFPPDANHRDHEHRRCGASAEAAALSNELSRRFPEATLTTHIVQPVIAAATAIRAGQPARALDLLEPVRRFEHSPVAEFWPQYLRGQAQLQLKRYSDAAREFQGIVDHRGELADAPLYPLAYLSLGRALALGGDRPAAREAYKAFFMWWKNADPGLQAIKEARIEVARLQQ
jgi:predicted Zn-dependent protease